MFLVTPLESFVETDNTAIDQIAKANNVCSACKAVRPFLSLIASFPFLPASWKKAVTAFMTAMDALCS